MKINLLICFILCFYSINSVTLEACGSSYEKCKANCDIANNRTFSENKNCRNFCSSKFNECARRAEKGV